MLNHLQTLGLSYGATPEQVRAAWKKSVRLHHPDKGGDEKMMQAVNAAWDALKDLSHQDLAAPTRAPQPNGPMYFDDDAIQKTYKKQFSYILDTVIKDAITDWIVASQKSDPLSYFLHLPVRTLPDTEPFFVHYLRSIWIDETKGVHYTLSTKISKGKNLFILPNVDVLGAKIRLSHYWNQFHTVDEPFSTGLILRYAHKPTDHIDPGKKEPFFVNPTEAEDILVEGTSLANRYHAHKTRLQGTSNPVWKPIAKAIRWLIEVLK